MHMDVFMQSLELMGKGMLGIFVVIVVIYIVVQLLTRIKDGSSDN